jgi:hypothetical protein
MPDWITRQLPESWGTTQLVVAAAVFTVTTAVVSIVVTAAVLVRLPHDYFACDPRSGACRTRPRFIHYPLVVLKNLLGVLLVALGIVLSLPGVPGQGILTILIGAMLIDFPGKRRVERWLLERRGVLGTINKVRARYGRPPLVLDAPAAAA